MALAALVLAATIAAPFSLQVGRPATDLESHTGVWEMRVAPDEVIGISLSVDTNVPARTTNVRATKQIVTGISLQTYMRRNGVRDVSGRFKRSSSLVYSPYEAGSTITWWNSSESGDFTLQRGSLHLRQTQSFAVTLDLIYDDSIAGWRGRYSTPYYTGNVTLLRPRMNAAGTPAGTWSTNLGCIHAGIGHDDQLVLWADYLTAQTGTFQRFYGSPFADTMSAHQANFWNFLYANGTWSERYAGTLSKDGSEFSGEASDHQGNGVVPIGNPPRPFVWKRVVGDSCLP